MVIAKIEISANSIAAVGRTDLRSVPTEMLLATLRERVAARGFVVNIDPVQPFAPDNEPALQAVA